MEGFSKDVEIQMRRLFDSLSEKDRSYAAVEAAKLGHGGVTHLARLFDCHPDTIRQGRADVARKCDPIDHRLFFHLSRALNGRLCESLEWMQLLYSKVTSRTGITVVAELARSVYQSDQKAGESFRACEPSATRSSANTITSCQSPNDEVMSEQSLSPITVYVPTAIILLQEYTSTRCQASNISRKH